MYCHGNPMLADYFTYFLIVKSEDIRIYIKPIKYNVNKTFSSNPFMTYVFFFQEFN